MHAPTAVRGTASLLLGAVALISAACGGTTTTEVGGPAGVRCETTVSAPGGQVPSNGATLNLTVGAARDCIWSAAADASWLAVRPSNGQGEGEVVVTVAPNAQSGSRTSHVTINGRRVTITQAGATQAGASASSPACQLELDRRNAEVDHTGDSIAVEVITPRDCAWQVSGVPSWIHPHSAASTGPATLRFDVAPNTGSTRSATLAIRGVSFTVTQYGPPGGSSGGTPTACTVNLAPPSRTFDGKGGDGSFRIVTSDGCPWTASAGASWISLRSSASGTGPAEIRYRVEENRVAVLRTASIRVAGQNHTVAQEAGKGEKVKLDGRISGLSGACPDVTFSLGRWTVVTDNKTKYDDGACRDLRNGTEVKLEGETTGDDRVLAREIELDD